MSVCVWVIKFFLVPMVTPILAGSFYKTKLIEANIFYEVKNLLACTEQLVNIVNWTADCSYAGSTNQL